MTPVRGEFYTTREHGIVLILQFIPSVHYKKPDVVTCVPISQEFASDGLSLSFLDNKRIQNGFLLVQKPLTLPCEELCEKLGNIPPGHMSTLQNMFVQRFVTRLNDKMRQTHTEEHSDVEEYSLS